MLEIYTDGSCLDHGRENARGGWAFVVTTEGNGLFKELEGRAVISKFSGKLRSGKQTNNRAELEAVLHALDYIYQTDTDNATLYMDSTTVADGIIGTSNRNANRDIWSEIENVIDRIHSKKLSFDVKHTPRNSSIFNKMADKLARTAANSLLYSNDNAAREAV